MKMKENYNKKMYHLSQNFKEELIKETFKIKNFNENEMKILKIKVKIIKTKFIVKLN